MAISEFLDHAQLVVLEPTPRVPDQPNVLLVRQTGTTHSQQLPRVWCVLWVMKHQILERRHAQLAQLESMALKPA